MILLANRLKTGFFIPVFFIFFSISAYAAVETSFPSVGITGGPVFAIAVSDDSNDSVYVATGDGIFKSEYEEDIWRPVNTGLGSTYVYDVVLHPVTSTIIYSATEGGIFYSTDGGEKWVTRGLKDSKVYSLAIHSVSTTYLAAGTVLGVFTSTDGGSSWTKNPTGPQDVFNVAYDPDTSSKIYAGSFGKGIYRSTDFGATWSKTGDGPSFVQHIAVNPASTSILYAATNSGIYKSTDSGTAWSIINADLSGVPVYSIAISPSNPSIVYAATDMGAYKTTDAGSSWSRIISGIAVDGTQGPFVREIVIDPSSTATLYAGIYSGATNDADIYKSTNSGSSWVQINRELANTTVYCLAFDSENQDVVYAGTGTIGIIKSSNSGLSWNEANKGLTKYLVKAIAVNPDSSTVYAGTTSGLFISTNAGDEWEEASPNYDIYSIGIDPHTPENIFIGTNWGIFLSTDDGGTWSSLNNKLENPSVLNIVFHPDDSGTLYVGTNGDGIFKSTSGGESWLAINEGLDYLQVLSLAIDSSNPDTLFAGTRGGGVYRSSNAGETWEIASRSFGGLSVNSIVINPDDPEIVYAGMESRGFYRSVDGGESWEVGSNEISDKTVYALAFDPENSQTLFAAIEGDISIFTFNSLPYPPSDPSPADEAVNQPVTATLSWTASDPDAGDSLSYKVYFGTDEDPKANNAVKVTSTDYDPGVLMFGQTYYWQITAVDSQDAETQGPVWSFSTVISTPPLVPSNPSPKNGSEDVPLPVTLSWSGGDTDNSDIVVYDLYLGIFEPPPLKKENLEKASYQSTTALMSFTTYYWKIVSRDNNGLETQGPVWSFKTGMPEKCYFEKALSSKEPVLNVLRRFRDTCLMKTEQGRALVALYYILSPALVSTLEHLPEFKKQTLELLEEIIPVIENRLQEGECKTDTFNVK